MTFSTMMRQPGAFVPVAMSGAALAVVVGAIAIMGVNAPPQQDEGTAAHLWQLFIAGQLPIVAFFAVKWLPRAPKPALQVLALQAVVGLAAVLPVFLLGW